MAEVLITLAIIGVVAALSLPVLIGKYQKTVTEIALKRFYSAMNQAITMASLEYGDVKEWPFASTDDYDGKLVWFNTYFKPYIKITGVQNVTFNNNGLVILFADGSAVRLSYYGHDYYCIHAKNLLRQIGVRGKDGFYFGFYPGICTGVLRENNCNKGIEPHISSSWNGTREDLFRIGSHAKLIQLNNWTIPNDYPIKF